EGRRGQLKSLSFKSRLQAEPSAEIATIYLADSRTTYRLMFHGTQCIESTGLPAHATSPLQLLSGPGVEAQSDGAEVMDGHPCKIQNAEITTNGRTVRFKLWEAQDL